MIEKITEKEMLELQGKHYAEISEQQRIKDEELGKILVDGPAADYAASIENGEISDSDAIDIDVSGAGSIRGDSNEGSLLPEDF
jgi:hypothetical protein